MGNFGPAEMLVIAIFALLVFGPRRFPEIARSVGKAVREFKKATSEFTQELSLEVDEPVNGARKKTPESEGKELRPGPRD
ncbi:MAG TPA: twin-arginine translocase TatA/TatE family subunit [Actinomycetota bacterium]|nr:twin-arginine translocase TatA/TatE family subunit [Actinomycetota bacterium]